MFGFILRERPFTLLIPKEDTKIGFQGSWVLTSIKFLALIIIARLGLHTAQNGWPAVIHRIQLEATAKLSFGPIPVLGPQFKSSTYLSMFAV